jgi:myo-inositol 2-dehydrogenase/D-chiro-inositol 1-dehydrogenase
MAVRIGILGAGFMGRTHGRILRRDPRVELAGVHDVEPARSTEAARELECRVFETEEALLEIAEAVYVAVPNALHAAAAGRALAAGRHVFCEKPFATTLDAAGALRAAVEASGRVFVVGHNRRFAPVYQAVRQALGEGPPPSLAHFKMNRGELQAPAWVARPEVTGGYLFETPVHLLDLARWLFGEVAEIRAAGTRRASAELDNVSLLVAFESGLSLTFASCAHATWAFPSERVEVFGPYWTIETGETERIAVTRGLEAVATVRDFSALPVERRRGHEGIDRHFVSAVLGEEPACVTAEDGYRSVELVERIYRLLR